MAVTRYISKYTGAQIDASVEKISSITVNSTDINAGVNYSISLKNAIANSSPNNLLATTGSESGIKSIQLGTGLSINNNLLNINLTGGNGISITGNQISNSGVLSVEGKTGAITLSYGLQINSNSVLSVNTGAGLMRGIDSADNQRKIFLQGITTATQGFVPVKASSSGIAWKRVVSDADGLLSRKGITTEDGDEIYSIYIDADTAQHAYEFISTNSSKTAVEWSKVTKDHIDAEGTQAAGKVLALKTVNNALKLSWESLSPGSAYTATTPIEISGSNIQLKGISGLGTAGQVLAVNSGATGLEWVNNGGGSGTDTWRPIKLNGVEILSNSTSSKALDLKAGTNVTLSENNGTVTITSAKTDYTAGSGITIDTSLSPQVLSITGAAGAASGSVLKADGSGGVSWSDDIDTWRRIFIKRSDLYFEEYPPKLNLRFLSGSGIKIDICNLNGTSTEEDPTIADSDKWLRISYPYLDLSDIFDIDNLNNPYKDMELDPKDNRHTQIVVNAESAYPAPIKVKFSAYSPDYNESYVLLHYSGKFQSKGVSQTVGGDLVPFPITQYIFDANLNGREMPYSPTEAGYARPSFTYKFTFTITKANNWGASHSSATVAETVYSASLDCKKVTY